LCRTGALAAAGLQMPLAYASANAAAPVNEAVILCYHRFADTVADSMTVRKSTFKDHIAAIQQAGAHVIPLADLVAHHQGKLASLPPKSVVITIDDGHRSVYEELAPMADKLGWPMTLFIYPSAISNASYAMRWEQIKKLQDTGHYNIQSHTYWHPNLVKERKQQSPADFERFAMNQLERSRKVLQDRMGQPVSYLAWPFGMLDDGLMNMAAAAGYQTALALGNKPCVKSDPIQALPRYLMVDELSGKRLSQILQAI
jgi:peptidoglycan/xylan/chitin deacetylase (PgdA/CDA1 family)